MAREFKARVLDGLVAAGVEVGKALVLTHEIAEMCDAEVADAIETQIPGAMAMLGCDGTHTVLVEVDRILTERAALAAQVAELRGLVREAVEFVQKCSAPYSADWYDRDLPVSPALKGIVDAIMHEARAIDALLAKVEKEAKGE